jgi:SH3 domain protein
MATMAIAQDNQRWITDQLTADMRRGQSNRHAITRMVPSGTAVQLLQTDKASGYSRIRTPSGAEGWVLSRYLMAQPPARVRVPELEARVRSLAAQQTSASGELQTVTRERDDLRRQVQALEASGRSLEQQLSEARSLSADTAKIANQNRLLTDKIARAEQQISELDARNRALSDSGRRDWFLAGAGVLGAGLVLGLVLPRIRWKKKDAWGRL